MLVSVAWLALPQGGWLFSKRSGYIISSKLEKRYYPMKVVSNKTASCNYHQHTPAALQILNPFSLGQHLLTTLQRSGKRLHKAS